MLIRISYLFLVLILIVLILFKYFDKLDLKRSNIKKNTTTMNDNFENNDAFLKEIALLNKCQVPTLNTEQCYKSKFYECPIVNGSYLQCTNNYIPKPTKFNSNCENRAFEMTPYPEKISENCYYTKSGFDRNKFKLKNY
jgi:hypothetical protein